MTTTKHARGVRGESGGGSTVPPLLLQLGSHFESVVMTSLGEFADDAN